MSCIDQKKKIYKKKTTGLCKIVTCLFSAAVESRVLIILQFCDFSVNNETKEHRNDFCNIFL